MRRQVALVPLAVTAAVSSVVLAGCSQQQGVTLARQACTHVKRSIRDYEAAQTAGDPADARSLAGSARQQLLYALPIAAQANSADGQWNALMTTISEVARVDESYLVQALRAQCKLADSNNPDQGPTGGGTVPGNGTLPPSSSSTPANHATTTTTAKASATTSTTTIPKTTSTQPSTTTTPPAKRHQKIDGATPVNGTLPGTPKPPGNGTLP